MKGSVEMFKYLFNPSHCGKWMNHSTSTAIARDMAEKFCENLVISSFTEIPYYRKNNFHIYLTKHYF